VGYFEMRKNSQTSKKRDFSTRNASRAKEKIGKSDAALHSMALPALIFVSVLAIGGFILYGNTNSSKQVSGGENVRESPGADSKLIDIVRKGTVSIDRSLTLGKALETYSSFENSEWRVTVDDRGRKLVLFEAKVVPSQWEKACVEIEKSLEKEYNRRISVFLRDAYNEGYHGSNSSSSITQGDVEEAQTSHLKAKKIRGSIGAVDVYMEFAVSVDGSSFDRHWEGFIVTTTAGEEKIIEDKILLENIYQNVLNTGNRP
jgi:hypothetical protein